MNTVTAYAYNADTNEVSAKFVGNNEKSIETKFGETFDADEFGLTFCDLNRSELVTDGDFDIIDVRG